MRIIRMCSLEIKLLDQKKKGALRWTLTSGQGDNCKLLHTISGRPCSSVGVNNPSTCKSGHRPRKPLPFDLLSLILNLAWIISFYGSLLVVKSGHFHTGQTFFPSPFGKIYQYPMQHNNSDSRIRKPTIKRHFPRSTRLIQLVRCSPTNSCSAVMTRWCSQSKGHLAGPSSSSSSSSSLLVENGIGRGRLECNKFLNKNCQSERAAQWTEENESE
ncbi:hypothetical protein T11_9654 [Trichinella zimbabwensis]|uniref:Uncharacterized protein n=1 Tax=Trichinella zimbabwensis TaxID=268475 RepID=A0A0V1GZY2_9BILA|nr:hypothetical protein T11_9654 [Trichinella zimbabwensis]